MNMKRQIIICVILITLLVFFIFLFNKIIKRDENHGNGIETERIYTENNTDKATEISKDSGYRYVIMEEEGRLTVYETTYNTIFMDTAIKAIYLPEELQEDLLDGIYFETDKDMFDFLESYSS